MKTILCLFACLFAFAPVRGESIYDVSVKDIAGDDVKLSAYRGKVLLIVNVASRCGFTRQYTPLEALYSANKDAGLVVLGFPCNQFGGQEPGTKEEIKEFCSTKFKISFPLFDKIEVNGPGRHPLYTFLSGEASPFPGKIGWNFTKFLVGRDGRIIARFDSGTEPDSPKFTAAVAAALAAK